MSGEKTSFDRAANPGSATRWALLLGGALALAVGCDSPTAVEGPTVPMDVLDRADEGGLYVQVELRRTAGVTRVVSTRWLDSEAGLTRASTGDHVLVTRNATGIEDAAFFSFPTVIRGESLGSTPMFETTPIGDDTVAFVNVLASAGTTEFVLYGPDAAVALTFPPPAGIDAPLRLMRAGSELSASSESALTLNAFSTYPHIGLFQPTDLEALPPTLRTDRVSALLDLDHPDNAGARTIIERQLRQLPPPVARAIARIGLANYGTERTCGDTWASTWGNVIVLNNACMARIDSTATLVHEAVHAYENALYRDTESEPGVVWPADVLAEATARLNATRLRVGLAETWGALHASAVPMFARPYTRAASPEGPTTMTGVVEAYGGTHRSEDIATYATRLIAPAATSEASICSDLRAARNVSAPLATAFAKMSLLRSVGIVTREQFEACTGGLAVRAPLGITVHEGSRVRYAMANGVNAGFDTGRTFLRLLASSATDRGLIEMPTRRGEPPLGFQPRGAVPGIYIDHTSGDSNDFAAERGAVFLAEVNSEEGTMSGFAFNVAFSEERGSGSFVAPLITFRYQR
jgi:hypothetical protein